MELGRGGPWWLRIRTVRLDGVNRDSHLRARQTLFRCVRVDAQKAIRGMVQEFETREEPGYTVSISSFGLLIASD